MSRKPRIRYSDKDKSELRALQQQVNNRIYYQRSKGGDTSHLPDTIKISDLEDSIATRADLNFQKNQLKRMLTKDAFETIKTDSGREFTKGEARQISNMVRRENIKRSYKRKAQVAKDLLEGKVLGSEMSDANKPRKFDLKTANPTYVDAQVERIKRMSMDSYEDRLDKLYQENYIKGVLKNYSSQDEQGRYVIEGDVKKLINKLKKMDPYEFRKRYERDDRLTISYRYIVDMSEDSPASYLLELWK